MSFTFAAVVSNKFKDLPFFLKKSTFFKIRVFGSFGFSGEMQCEAPRQFGQMRNRDRKPDSDQIQMRSEFCSSAEIIFLVQLLDYQLSFIPSYFLKYVNFANFSDLK